MLDETPRVLRPRLTGEDEVADHQALICTLARFQLKHSCSNAPLFVQVASRGRASQIEI